MVDLCKVEHRFTIILIVGEAIPHWFIRQFQHGLSKSLILKMIWLKIIIRLIGCLNPYSKKGSIIGLKMPKIGVFLEIDSGVTPFQSGYLMMDNKLFVLGLSSSLKNSQGKKSSICTDNTSTIWLLNQDREKENLKELKKFLTVGFKADPCLLLKFIIHSVRMNKSSKRYFLLILLEKVLIKPEDGFIP